jgi:dolichyl-diphosphooligosaccharide--protein glycosyltransferase
MTTTLWQIISEGKVKELTSILTEYPEAAFLRSSDGRGPMWWAYEKENKRMIRVLKLVGVSDELRDAHGISPRDLYKKRDQEL